MTVREFLENFEEVSLIKQQRATDPRYATSASALRMWTHGALKTCLDFLDRSKEITSEEFTNPAWQEATHNSRDHETVHVVNEMMLKRYAIAQELPIMAWRLPMVDKYEKKFRNDAIFIYDTVKDMTAYLVPNAPCCLTINLRLEKGLSNGTHGCLHSIVLHPDEVQSRAQEICDARPGSVVLLDYPPFCVAVGIVASALSASECNIMMHRK